MKSRKVILLYFLISALTVTGVFSAEKSIDPLPPLAPNENHGRIAQEIGNALRFYHYAEPKLDDSLSAHFFDTYIETLDPQKSYFLSSDIVKFYKHRFMLDDYIKQGNVDFAFEVINVLRGRMTERINFVLSLDQKSFDFSGHEFYVYNRESASYFITTQEQDEFWRKRVKYEVLNLKLAGKEVEKSEETLEKRYTNLYSALKKQNSEDVFQFYMNALTEVVDPHSSYFSPRTAEGFKINMSNSLEGIGATLSTEGEYTVIVELVKGGPADKSKQIMKNDRIVAVGQETGEMEDVLGWRIDDVVSKIRGPKGSVVRLEILPSGSPDGRTKRVSLVRDKIKLEEQSAKGEVKMVGKTKIGVVRIPSFYFDFEAYQKGEKDYKSTSGDVAKILADFKRQKVKGVVVDLRDNGGGSLIEAVELTGLFLPRGPIVQVRDASGQVDVKYDDPGISWEGPLCVVVGRFSASASEIFAGAIQDYGRGLVVGSQTYGKGTVQNLMDLNRLIPQEPGKLGQLKMTLAKFYRVTGSSTQHKGVEPDILFPSPFPAEEYGESSEKYALEWDQIQSLEFPANNAIKTAIPMLLKLHNARMNQNPEYKFYIEDIEDFRVKKEALQISLNEETLKAEREAEKAKDAERKKILDAFYEKNLPKKKKKGAEDQPERDFVLEEACEILKDWMAISN